MATQTKAAQPKPEVPVDKSLEPTKPEPALPARASEEAPAVFDADDPISLYMDSNIFAQLQRVGKLMCSSALVPEHLRGEPRQADCFLVAAQAFRWRMDPFAVAQHTFVLRGKLGYEGKLIAAVINSNSRIAKRLNYTYDGEGQGRTVVVTAAIKGESEARTVRGSVGDWATDNEQWKKSPDQMLAYRGAREWARRHMPEAMIGIQADEEVIAMERSQEGAFAAAPRTLDQLTDKLKKPADCSHPQVPPSRVSKLKAGETLPCGECGANVSNPDAPAQASLAE